MEKIGIKESRELLVAVKILSILLIRRFKDGFQADDLPVILSALATDPKIIAAFKDLSEIPSEMKDIDLEEGLELGMILLKAVPEIVEALKK